MSNISCGIVGLPNVGKSTLFNALLKKQQALAANYPFATIEPNVGIVAVPDYRLERLAQIVAETDSHGSMPPVKPATVEFYDIAGLVKGASTGEGLGNKFLSHIRETKIIAHVVRAFEDPDVIKEGAVDPKSDYEVINAELILADLATVQNQESRSKKQDENKEMLAKLRIGLEKGIPARNINLTKEENEMARNLYLLSAKPEIVVLNVSEDQYNPQSIDEMSNEYARGLGIDLEKIVVISSKIESELASLSGEEQKEYLKDLGLSQSGLERLIQKAYQELGLISFLTAGAKEVRAWTIKKGTSAQNAAGEIHNDFIKKFIKAEIVSYDNFIELGGWKGAREKGRARLEGRDYVIHDGEVIEFKIGN